MIGDFVITADGAHDDSGPLMPAAAAARLTAWLEAQGAVFTLDAQEFFKVDFNPIEDMTFEKADVFSRAVLSLRDEIRAILVARRTLH